MSVKRFFTAPAHSTGVDLALLLTRFVAGFAFMMHGWPKIQQPFSWTEGFPGILQALAALSEFGGGIAWVLGLVTPLASLGIGCTMSVAFWTHAVTRGDPFVSKGGPAYESAAVYFCVALLLFTLGPGQFSLDKKLFRG
jgi:putative oxidoreductase